MIADRATVKQLMERLAIPCDMIRVVFVNGVIRDDKYLLKEGDEIGIFPPVAGGA